MKKKGPSEAFRSMNYIRYALNVFTIVIDDRKQKETKELMINFLRTYSKKLSMKNKFM